MLSIRTYTGTLLPVADDGSVEVPLTTFQFPFQGTSWSSVLVNGNGNLTFGAGDPDFSETRARAAERPAADRAALGRPQPGEFRTGVPQGLVIAEETPGRCRCTS